MSKSLHRQTADDYVETEKEVSEVDQVLLLLALMLAFDYINKTWDILTRNRYDQKAAVDELREVYGTDGDSPLHRWLKYPRGVYNPEWLWDASIALVILNLRADLNDTMGGVVGRRVRDVAVSSTKILDTYFGITSDPSQYYDILTNMIMNNPWSERHFSASIWRDTELLKSNLQELFPAVFRGQITIEEASRRLSKYHKVSNHAARRLLFTEFNALNARVQQHIAIHNGIEMFQLIAILDNRTSEICKGLDRTVGYWRTAEIGIDLPPFHPWCRTVAVYYKKTS